MRYWLFKSEPSTFSIDDLIACRDKTDAWNGVRNYQARNFLRDQMKVGDKGFFYHSNCKTPGITGTVLITRSSYPDETQFDIRSDYYDKKSSIHSPRWFVVDVQCIEKFSSIISLQELKIIPELADMLLLRKGNRLSVLPVTEKQWDTILNSQ